MVCDAGAQRRGSVKLWQFLLLLLQNSKNRHIIAWTGRGRGRFRLINPDEVSSINLNLTWNSVSPNSADTAVSAEGNGDLQTLICVLVARPRRCLTLSNPVPWQNWMAAYLGYTLQMRTLFRGWPIMVNDTHTRRRRSNSTATGLLLYQPHVEELSDVAATVDFTRRVNNMFDLMNSHVPSGGIRNNGRSDRLKVLFILKYVSIHLLLLDNGNNGTNRRSPRWQSVRTTIGCKYTPGIWRLRSNGSSHAWWWHFCLS